MENNNIKSYFSEALFAMEETLVISWRKTDSPPPVTEESTVIFNVLQSQQVKEYALTEIKSMNEIKCPQISSCIINGRIYTTNRPRRSYCV